MRAFFLVAIATMALSALACSSLDSGSRAVADVVAGSALASERKGNVAFEMTVENAATELGMDMDFVVEGVTDFESGWTYSKVDFLFAESETIYADGVSYSRGFSWGGDESLDSDRVGGRRNGHVRGYE